MTRPDTDAGFTLIEALVAMLILAIASAGLIRATETHIDSVREMERRTAASLAAQNHLALWQMGAVRAVASRPVAVEILGHDWTISETRKATADRDIAALNVSVRAPGAREATLSLDGFVDTGR